MAGAGGEEVPPPAACPEVMFKGDAGELGDRHATALGLMAQPGIEVVRNLHGRSWHIHEDIGSRSSLLQAERDDLAFGGAARIARVLA